MLTVDFSPLCRKAIAGDENTKVRDALRVQRDKVLKRIKQPVAVKTMDKVSVLRQIQILRQLNWAAAPTSPLPHCRSRSQLGCYH